MHPDLPAVRLLAAIACGAGKAQLRARREAVSDEGRLLEIASMLGISIALDVAADALDLAVDSRRRLAASAMVSAIARDASLRLLASLHAGGAPSERAIVIKGGAMALTHRGTANRVVSDLDVVVPRSDVPVWLDVAARCGASVHETSGYEAAHIARERGMIELHLALPGFAGNDAGPGWELLRTRARPVEGGPWLVPEAPAAREIAVQHFLFHHFGESSHALRALQDLTLLEEDGEGEGLDWGGPPVARATTRLREIARSIRTGRDDDEPLAFLSGLAGVLGGATARSFAEESRHWVGQRAGAKAKIALLFRRLVPPLREMRRSPGESALTVAARYARRPFELVAKYRATARSDHERTSALAGWREEVERLGR
ncbi:MAG: nucleotidyltransferase family protein [Acidobacteria bacterium]|nr:nucleotidyltransferase family protein [Acidobacteriota bacterium]